MDTLSTTNLLMRRLAQRVSPTNPVRVAAARVWEQFLQSRSFITLEINGMRIKLSPKYRSHASDYEADAMRSCFALCPRGSVVWDIGANVGMYAIQLALYAQPKSVLAVELHPETARLLTSHIAANEVGHVITPLVMAANDGSRDSIELALNASPAGDLSARMTSLSASEGTKVRVAAASLDQLVERRGEVPNLLKIDVEGAEFDVLTGARRLLAGEFGPKPIAILSAHPMFIGEYGRTLQDVTNLLRAAGYVSLSLAGDREDPERFDEFWLVPAEREEQVAHVLRRVASHPRPSDQR